MVRIRMALDGPPGSFKTTLADDFISFVLGGLPPKAEVDCTIYSRQSANHPYKVEARVTKTTRGGWRITRDPN